jgi:hypothetical protein
MLRITTLFISLAFVTGLFATEREFTPFSGGNQTEQSVYAHGGTSFDLGNLFWIAGFKGEGNITTTLSRVSYMTKGQVKLGSRTVSRTQSGSGEGGIGEDLFDQTAFGTFFDGVLQNTSNANFPNASFNEEILKDFGSISSRISSQGEFYYDIQAKNLTNITFKLPGQQSASLSTSGGAEGAITVVSSFALYNANDPISSRALASDTRSISFSSTGGVNVDKFKEWNGNFIVSYNFSNPFTGDLLLKGSTLSSSRMNVSERRSAGAPEPSLFISMAASLAGLLAMRMRKKQIS